MDAAPWSVKTSLIVVSPQRNVARVSPSPVRDAPRAVRAPAKAVPDELDTIAVALTASAGAATDRIASAVRALAPDAAPDPAALAALQTDVRTLHAAMTHLRALHGEGDLVARPAPELLDASTLACEVAEELLAEGLQVQVEGAREGLLFPGNAPDVRRILRWVIARATASDGAPWVRLQVTVDEGSVVFDLPWPEDDASSTADTERDWLVHLIHEQAGSLSTRGFRARVAFPLEPSARDVLRDPDTLAREIVALREQRVVYARESSAVQSQLIAAQSELALLRAYAARLEGTLREAALDLRRNLENVTGSVAALAERDAAAVDVQSGVQTALDRVVLLLQEASVSAYETSQSHVGPRVHSEEPDALDALIAYGTSPEIRPASDARTIPPDADPDEAVIPLAERP